MNKLAQKFRILSSAVFLVLFSNTPVLAEDIEIYKKDNTGGGVSPNILFILDTSGSMGEDITLKELYQPSVDYGLRAGACFGTKRSNPTRYDNDQVYPINPSAFSSVDCSTTYTKTSYDMSLVQCDYAQQNFGTDATDSGFFQDTYSQWLGGARKVWDIVQSNSTGYYIECAADQGVHGDGGTSLYVNNSGSTPYTSDSTNQESTWINMENAGQAQDMTLVSANYLNYLVTSSDVTTTKIDVMRNVIANLTFSISGVNVGLMRFNEDSEGGTVKHQVSDVLDTRNDMYSTMQTWNANGGTPLSEALYEAYRYFSGMTEEFAEVTEGSATITENGVRYYNSPVDPDLAECQRQFVIMLSDGQPHEDYSANSLIENLPGFTGIGGGTACDGPGITPKWTSFWTYETNEAEANGRCLDDLANYMRDVGTDAYLGGGVTATDIDITTYTVAFDNSIPLMQSAGNHGVDGTIGSDDGYFEAYDATGLLQTLIAIIDEIKSIHATFSSPAVSVNAYNRTTHRSDLYFSLFKPSTKPHWDGNFKRFKLEFDNGNPVIMDASSPALPAIDNATGFFRNDITSYWTQAADAPDGNETSRGGAASRLTTNRNVYTMLGVSALNNASNLVHENNTNLTKTLLGIDTQTDAYRDSLLQFARGLDVSGNARRVMGDPLHSQPALVEYGDGATDNPDITAYVATNDGYLHAIDTRNGEEIFSFIPPELLPNLNLLYSNSAATNKVYGLDGTVAALIKDHDEDGEIETIDGDKVYLYVGMRRGGSNYYALDVTDRNNPVLMWTIYGGTGDFTELGQSWSTPMPRKIKYRGNDVDVLIFAAGYDTDQDNYTARAVDDIGRGIFIVNALTGDVIYKIGPTAGANTLQLADMVYSIPSDVAAIDSNGDDYVDLIYVGDMGGQVWRIDIDNREGEKTDAEYSNMIKGGRIADLAGDTTFDNRRFYYSPDVALIKDDAGGFMFNIIIGSGYRAHPTYKTTQDRVYMIRDQSITGSPSSYVTLTEADLFDTTDNIIGDGTEAEKEAAATTLSGTKGWYIGLNFATGEKALAKPLIFNEQVFFTTYEPYDPTTQVAVISCQPNQGYAFLYTVNIGDGTPVVEEGIVDHAEGDAYETCAGDARCGELPPGIPPEPKVIMADDEAICVGLACEGLDIEGKHKRIFWYEQ